VPLSSFLTMRLSLSSISPKRYIALYFSTWRNSHFSTKVTETLPKPKRRKHINRESISIKNKAHTKTKGIILSKHEIRRIWTRFDEEETVEEGTNTDYSLPTHSHFNLKEFLHEYPNVNPSLSSNCENSSVIEKETDGAFFLVPSSSTESSSLKKKPQVSSPLAEEAVLKLHRILDKVKSAELNEDVFPRILELVIEEFEAVVDLWAQLSVGSSMDDDGDDGDDDDRSGFNEGDTQIRAIEAAHMASNLLSQWEQDHKKGLREEMEYGKSRQHTNSNTLVFNLPAPSTRVYQNVINTWWHIYFQNKVKAPRNLSQIRDHATSLLEKMRKQLLSNRIYGAHYDVDLVDLEKHIYSSIGPLNDTYNQIICMWTCLNESEGKEVKKNAGELMKSVNRASSILKEMELIYHDTVMATPLSLLSSSDTIRKRELELLLTIFPTTDTFNLVLFAYSKIASTYDFVPAANAADVILERMEKRCLAYSSYKMGSGTGQHSKPNFESYRAVIQAWRRFSSPKARSRVKTLSEKMKNLSTEDK